MGWTLELSTPAGHGAITYAYNALGQKLSVTNGSKVTGYSYYANGWLKEVKWGGNSVATYTYDAVGNRDRVDLANDTYTLYGHADNPADPRYLIASIAHWKTGEQTAFSTIGYTRDNAGNPLSMGSTSYTYDNNSRLDSATGFDYSYDWVGNRLNPPTSPGPMQYNAADQLTVWPGQHQYAYLDTGSLSQQLSADGNTVEKEYTYTAANLLSEVEHLDVLNSPSSSMAWDADSNRVSFTSSESGAGTWYFVYDTTAGIPAVVEEITPADGSIYYVREPGGELIARGTWDVESGSVLARHYYHFDELGSTRLLTDDDGDVTDTYAYDAWGQLIDHEQETGSVDQPYMYVGRLGYYSHHQDTNLFSQNGYQFLQLGVRFYDALTGRFTQVDPAEDGYNAYNYVSDMPITSADPLGLWELGPTNNVTTQLCKQVCAALGFKDCSWCNKVSGNTHCNGMMSLCNDLRGHPRTRKYAAACDGVYNALCKTKPKPKPKPSPVPVPAREPSKSKAKQFAADAAKAGAAAAALVVTWEVIKWGAAIILAPETCGGSLAAAAVCP